MTHARRAAARIAVVESADDAAGEAALGADIVVFVADAGGTLDRARTVRIAENARERGTLVAAIVVDSDRRIGSALLETLRDAADMVVIVRERADAEAVIAALR